LGAALAMPPRTSPAVSAHARVIGATLATIRRIARRPAACFYWFQMKTDADITKEVQDEFARLDVQAGPGLTMLLEVYGGVEAAQLQAEAYLGVEHVEPLVTTTSNTESR